MYTHRRRFKPLGVDRHQRRQLAGIADQQHARREPDQRRQRGPGHLIRFVADQQIERLGYAFDCEHHFGDVGHHDTGAACKLPGCDTTRTRSSSARSSGAGRRRTAAAARASAPSCRADGARYRRSARRAARLQRRVVRGTGPPRRPPFRPGRSCRPRRRVDDQYRRPLEQYTIEYLVEHAFGAPLDRI